MAFDPNHKLTRGNLKDLPPLCADGAWGTEMIKLGAKAGEICDAWNLEAPEKVLSVPKAYVDAGAQVVLTNTFSSNRIMLANHGLADRAADIARAGAEISRRAAEGRAYVFGSIGPCGKMVMMGEIGPQEVEESAAEEAAALAEGGADAIVIETQTDLVEAEAALRGALGACDLPVGVSFTFDSGADHDRTMMGVSIEQVCEMARTAGVAFVGANCGVGIETFAGIAEKLAACGSDLPIWIKGNAGLPQVGPDGNVVYSASPEAYADAVEPLLKAGARFIGGCCGSGPEHVRAIAERMASPGRRRF